DEGQGKEVGRPVRPGTAGSRPDDGTRPGELYGDDTAGGTNTSAGGVCPERLWTRSVRCHIVSISKVRGTLADGRDRPMHLPPTPIACQPRRTYAPVV